MSSTRNDKNTPIELPPETSERCLNASSELDQLREENELLKIENEQLNQQIEQWKESIRKHNERIEQWKESIRKNNDRIDRLEEIIDKRDTDIGSLKEEIVRLKLELRVIDQQQSKKCTSDLTREHLERVLTTEIKRQFPNDTIVQEHIVAIRSSTPAILTHW